MDAVAVTVTIHGMAGLIVVILTVAAIVAAVVVAYREGRADERHDRIMAEADALLDDGGEQ